MGVTFVLLKRNVCGKDIKRVELLFVVLPKDGRRDPDSFLPVENGSTLQHKSSEKLLEIQNRIMALLHFVLKQSRLSASDTGSHRFFLFGILTTIVVGVFQNLWLGEILQRTHTKWLA